MPTPTYTLRLPQEVQDDLEKMGRIYGCGNGRTFARECLEVMTSGDLDRLKEFNQRLVHRIGEQMVLEFNGMVERHSAEIGEKSSGKAAKKRPARKRPKKGGKT